MSNTSVRRTLAAIAVGGVLAASGLLWATEAHANAVCDYLDTHPGVAGVEDLVAASHYALPDSTDFQHGQAIAVIVASECPRHLFDLDAFAAKWGQPGFAA